MTEEDFTQYAVPEDENGEPEFDVTDPLIANHEFMGGNHQPLRLEAPDPRNFNIFSIGARGGVNFNIRAVVRYVGACHVVYDGGVWRAFDGRVYSNISEKDVTDMMYRAIDACAMNYMPTKNEIANIVNGAKALLAPSLAVGWQNPEDSEPYDVYDQNEALYAFENGILNTETGHLLPFTPSVYLTNYIHAMWYPTLYKTSIEPVLNGIIPDEATRRFFFEMVGYIMYARTMVPPALFVLYGPGETGKSALHHAICTALGWENVSQLGLEQLTQRFMTAELDGKLLNVSGESGDLGPFNRVNGELIKKLSDGQIIKVERKNGQPYDMRNTAKMLFVSNTVPNFGDTSSGLYRRVHIIPCRVKQRTSEMIYDKMTDPKSRSWLAVKAYEAYRDFVDRGYIFADSESMGVELSAFKSQDAFYDFLQTAFPDTPVQSYGEKIADDEELRYTVQLYALYHDFCISAKAQPMSRKKFVERIRNEFNLITKKKWYNGSTRDVYEMPWR